VRGSRRGNRSSGESLGWHRLNPLGGRSGGVPSGRVIPGSGRVIFPPATCVSRARVSGNT
jgi:hypothetical protein